MLYNTFDSQLKQPLFNDFNEFSESALGLDAKLDREHLINVALRCKNMSQTFALAYRCALQALVPILNPNEWAAMCVSESGGNHPKKIATQLEGGCISGEKSFITMGGLAKTLLVIAKQGEENGQPILKATLVGSEQTGVEMQTVPSLNMLVDVPHSKAVFKQAKAQVLPGDGYIQYSKEFRTLEDTHICLAACTFMFSLAIRYKLDSRLAQQALSLISQLAYAPLQSSPWLHLLLDEALIQFDDLVEKFEQQGSALPQEVLNEWQQDKKVFSIAKGARKSRLDKALNSLDLIKA